MINRRAERVPQLGADRQATIDCLAEQLAEGLKVHPISDQVRHSNDKARTERDGCIPAECKDVCLWNSDEEVQIRHSVCPPCSHPRTWVKFVPTVPTPWN